LRILKRLLDNPARVYSRAQLLELCFQPEQQICDRVIDSRIKNLCKKLDKPLQGKEVIHSVYDIGYRFEHVDGD
jgi:two-component system response regulator BaeR